ncbi:MAG: Lrp/AsnC family transcriptional regulator [Rubrivivax sp.]|nr:Lrp/AsnC family transcriptional regulator [Rubrivivax sp.]
MALRDFDRRLVLATQSGLPLVSRPYEAVAALLGTDSAAVREQLAAQLKAGLIRRIGAVPNHYRIGYTANGMTVWDVDDTQVDALGPRVAALHGVSHCSRRTRRPPDWPFNLYAMLRGRSRAEVEQQRQALRALLGSACRGDDILYSTAMLKKTGLRLGEDRCDPPDPDTTGEPR